jgi:hypothetical protein
VARNIGGGGGGPSSAADIRPKKPCGGGGRIPWGLAGGGGGGPLGPLRWLPNGHKHDMMPARPCRFLDGD